MLCASGQVVETTPGSQVVDVLFEFIFFISSFNFGKFEMLLGFACSLSMGMPVAIMMLMPVLGARYA
jgi:hypothetical protein